MVAGPTITLLDDGTARRDLAARRELKEVWRRRFHRHYPAMALLEVKGLVDEGALVEIEATAVLD